MLEGDVGADAADGGVPDDQAEADGVEELEDEEEEEGGAASDVGGMRRAALWRGPLRPRTCTNKIVSILRRKPRWIWIERSETAYLFEGGRGVSWRRGERPG